MKLFTEDYLKCPYCGHRYNNETSFAMDSEWLEECPKCEKGYRVTGWYVERFAIERIENDK